MTLTQRDLSRLHDLKGDSEQRKKQIALLLKEHRPLIHQALRRHRISREELEEIYHDTILDFLEKVDHDEFRQEGSISAFIQGIFFKKIANTFKKKDTHKQAPQEKVIYDLKDNVHPINPDVMQSYDREDAENRATYYLEKVGPKCRDLLILLYYRNFDMEEIAHRIGLKSARVVSVKKIECLKQLKAVVKAEEAKV